MIGKRAQRLEKDRLLGIVGGIAAAARDLAQHVQAIVRRRRTQPQGPPQRRGTLDPRGERTEIPEDRRVHEHAPGRPPAEIREQETPAVKLPAQLVVVEIGGVGRGGQVVGQRPIDESRFLPQGLVGEFAAVRVRL